MANLPTGAAGHVPAAPPAMPTAKARQDVRDDARKQASAAASAHNVAWQAYLQPNGTPKNKLGIEDAAELERASRRRVGARVVQMETGAAGPFAHTPAGYRALHRHLFQDVYEWAGRHREVNMSRAEIMSDGTKRHADFLHHREIEHGLKRAFDQMRPMVPRLQAEALKEPAQRNVRLVSEVAAAHVGVLNYIHAFRDGNGRAMRERVAHLAREAGMHFDKGKLDVAHWDEGSYRVITNPHDSKTLAEAIAGALSPREHLIKRQRAAEQGQKPQEREVHRGPLPPPKRTRRPPQRGRDGFDITD